MTEIQIVREFLSALEALDVDRALALAAPGMVYQNVPLPPARKTHARVKAEAMQRGLMVYPMGGTVDGLHGDHILLAPPFIATAQDIDAIVDRLGDAVEAATANALETA